MILPCVVISFFSKTIHRELFEALHECAREIRLASSELADVIKAANGFAVVGQAPPSIAARLRVSEKNFVIDRSLRVTWPWGSRAVPRCED